MVYIQPRIQTKTQKQSAYSLNTGKRLKKAIKTHKRLKKTTTDLHRLCQSTDSTTRLQKTPGIMANCNPVVSVMDWTEDAELHKRYVEWKEEVELELGSSLSNRPNPMKSNHVLRWAGKKY